MAMTAEVKDELSRLVVNSVSARRAEVASLLRFAGGLHIVAGAAHVGTRSHTAQHPNPGLAAVGPAQRQHRVGQRRHGRTSLHPNGLLGLQSRRSTRARLDGRDHRQADLPLTVTALGAQCQHIDTAHGIAVDGSLVEAGQRSFGHHLFGAHKALRLGDLAVVTSVFQPTMNGGKVTRIMKPQKIRKAKISSLAASHGYGFSGPVVQW